VDLKPLYKDSAKVKIIDEICERLLNNLFQFSSYEKVILLLPLILFFTKTSGKSFYRRIPSLSPRQLFFGSTITLGNTTTTSRTMKMLLLLLKRPLSTHLLLSNYFCLKENFIRYLVIFQIRITTQYMLSNVIF